MADVDGRGRAPSRTPATRRVARGAVPQDRTTFQFHTSAGARLKRSRTARDSSGREPKFAVASTPARCRSACRRSAWRSRGYVDARRHGPRAARRDSRGRSERAVLSRSDGTTQRSHPPRTSSSPRATTVSRHHRCCVEAPPRRRHAGTDNVALGRGSLSSRRHRDERLGGPASSSWRARAPAEAMEFNNWFNTQVDDLVSQGLAAATDLMTTPRTSPRSTAVRTSRRAGRGQREPQPDSRTSRPSRRWRDMAGRHRQHSSAGTPRRHGDPSCSAASPSPLRRGADPDHDRRAPSRAPARLYPSGAAPFRPDTSSPCHSLCRGAV